MPILNKYAWNEFDSFNAAMTWVNKQCAGGIYRLHTIWQFNSIRVVLELVPRA